MATNWQKAVSQEDFNELNAKVGESTDGETKATLFGKLAKVFQSVSSGKSKIATAITGKGIATLGSDTFAKMAGNIDLIKMVASGDASKILAGQNINGINGTATNDANAVAGDLLSGKSGYVKGLKVNGTMANKGAISQALAINGTYTIPPGYHNGSGKVTQSITTKAAQTYTPTTANQTIGAGQYLSGAQTIAGSGNLVAANIKKGVNLFGVVGNLVASRSYTSINDTAGYGCGQDGLPKGDYILAATYTYPSEIVFLVSSPSGNIPPAFSGCMLMDQNLHVIGNSLIPLVAYDTDFWIYQPGGGSKPCGIKFQIATDRRTIRTYVYNNDSWNHQNQFWRFPMTAYLA